MKNRLLSDYIYTDISWMIIPMLLRYITKCFLEEHRWRFTINHMLVSFDVHKDCYTTRGVTAEAL